MTGMLFKEMDVHPRVNLKRDIHVVVQHVLDFVEIVLLIQLLLPLTQSNVMMEEQHLEMVAVQHVL